MGAVVPNGPAEPPPSPRPPSRPRPRRRAIRQGRAPRRLRRRLRIARRQPASQAGVGSHLELVNSAIGATSFVGALMLYAGYIYTNAYFGYFHLDSFAMGFSPFELVMRSLRLATVPALETMALALLIPAIPRLLTASHLPERHIRRMSAFGGAVARAHRGIVATGVVLMLLWRWIQPYAWTAPLLVAVGLLLGWTRAAAPAGRSRRPPWERAVSLLVAGLFLIWMVALIAGQLGRDDARHDADQLVRRVAVVLLSTDPLSFAPPGPHVTDLGRGVHYRYRYSRLRLLIERDHRYYLLRPDWKKNTDAVYVIEDDDSIRIELRPGTQPRTLNR